MKVKSRSLVTGPSVFAITWTFVSGNWLGVETDGGVPKRPRTSKDR
jgi:hypothetical protein